MNWDCPYVYCFPVLTSFPSCLYFPPFLFLIIPLFSHDLTLQFSLASCFRSFSHLPACWDYWQEYAWLCIFLLNLMEFLKWNTSSLFLNFRFSPHPLICKWRKYGVNVLMAFSGIGQCRSQRTSHLCVSQTDFFGEEWMETWYLELTSVG